MREYYAHTMPVQYRYSSSAMCSGINLNPRRHLFLGLPWVFVDFSLTSCFHVYQPLDLLAFYTRYIFSVFPMLRITLKSLYENIFTTEISLSSLLLRLNHP